MTVLLDEPEKALSLEKQLELFDTLDELAKYFQVIMVSHSPFILLHKNNKKINYVDMTPDFTTNNKKLIKKYLGKI
jgi:predicted ATPase